MSTDRSPGGDEVSSDAAQSDRTEGSGAENRAPNTAINALLGATVTVITAFFIPLSPVLGGATAGYLEGAAADSGLKIGAVSGLIALLPLLVIVPVLLAVLVFDPIIAGSFLFLVAIVASFLVVYTVGLSAIGGVLGVYLYEEFGE